MDRRILGKILYLKSVRENVGNEQLDFCPQTALKSVCYTDTCI